MQCPKCGSSNVSVQLINEQKLKNAHHGILWWIFCSWWIWVWWLFKWVFLTIPALIGAFSKNRKQQIKNKVVSYGTCQSCGYHWKIRQQIRDTVMDSVPAEVAVSDETRKAVINAGKVPKFCIECGAPLTGNSRACTECGAPVRTLEEHHE